MSKLILSGMIASLILAGPTSYASDPPGADTARIEELGVTYHNSDYSLVVNVSGMQRVAQHERLTPPPIYPGYDYSVWIMGGPGWAVCWGSSDGHAIDVNAAATTGSLVLDTTAPGIFCYSGSTRYVFSVTCVANGNYKYDDSADSRIATPTEVTMSHRHRIGNEANCELTMGSQTYTTLGSISSTQVTMMDR